MNDTARTPVAFWSPLFFPALSLMMSITLSFLSLYHQRTGDYCFLFGLVLLTALVYTKNSPWFKPVLLCCSMALLGWLRTTTLFEHYHHFPFNTPLTSMMGEITAIAEHPSSRMKHTYTMTVTIINETTIPTSYTVRLYTAHCLPYEIGDIIALHNVTFKKANNIHFTHYLLKEGITATLFAPQLPTTLIKKNNYSLRKWFINQRNRILHAFKACLSPATFALFSSLFLGEKETNKNEIEKVHNHFKQWGILHYLARSGLHLVIVLSLYEFLLRWLPVSFVTKHLLLLLLNILYFLLTWPSVSFLRAFLIFICYKLYSLFYIPVHFLHILYLTCIVILLINPLHLFFLDFQLSFGFTFALGWLNQYKVAQKSPSYFKY